MKAIEFPEQTVIIGEHQPEYANLPAKQNFEEGSVTYCMELDDEELEQVKKTGKIWLKQYTGNTPFQPIGLSCLKSENI